MRVALVTIGLAGIAASAPTTADYVRPAPEKVEVAKGVYCLISKPYGDVGLDGNSVAILSDEGVLVFDTNGTPASSAAVLVEIRKLTDKPVRFLVYSHWHWDHWYGTETYTRAFPGVQVIAHEKARALMAGPAIDFNRPGIETQLPGYIASLERKAETDASVRPLLDEDRFFLDQKKKAQLVLPTVTYSDRLTVHLGGREIQVRHHDRAVTPGDTFLYLPAERLVISGDLLVNPIAFALSSYPTGWLRTLEAIDALAPSVIVPGHGQPLHDLSLLHAHMDVMRTLLRAGAEGRARGLDPDQVKDEVMPRLHEQMLAITGDAANLNAQFKTYLVDWYLHRVYDELAGPLTDAIAPIPPK